MSSRGYVHVVYLRVDNLLTIFMSHYQTEHMELIGVGKPSTTDGASSCRRSCISIGSVYFNVRVRLHSSKASSKTFRGRRWRFTSRLSRVLQICLPHARALDKQLFSDSGHFCKRQSINFIVSNLYLPPIGVCPNILVISSD
jgi:hypothetical protein